MRTRYGSSPWVSGFPDARRPAWPRVRGDLVTDVVIVGGGMTGCATAHALAHAGVRTLLVEAERIGQGSAGRGAGLLLPDPGPAFRDVAGLHGLRAARTMFESWRRAALDAAALLRRMKITCQLEPCAGLTVAAPEGERGLRREFDAQHGAGLDVSWLGAAQIRKASGLESGTGVRTHGAFTLDPYRACLGLAAGAVRQGGTIAERTRVQRIRARTRDVEVVVDGGTVRAAKVIVATGIATPEIKPLRRHFKVREHYLVLTEPVAAAVRKQILPARLTLADTRVPPHRIRWTPDDRLVVAGADQDETPARERAAVLTQRTGQLMYELLTMYPAISGLRPELGWEASYGETADGLMYIGPHRNYPRHLFALGGGGSLTGSFLAARILTRAVQEQPQKGDDVFGWTR
jgi:glycine/D-amino acid oxidase-like deaminating enzyme